MEKVVSFLQKPWSEPFVNRKFWGFLKRCLYRQKGLSFLESLQTHFPHTFCIKTKEEKIVIFWPKPWTYLIEKMQLKPILNRRFLKSNRSSFRSRFHENLFLDLFYTKTKGGESLNCLNRNHGLIPLGFWRNPMSNPFGKMQTWGLF